ncbi:hypothetical protein [Acidicapsa acidisoli]|uniref:hypothetical protein n=1 Tax=Acidicapsa acidisoli TaxID=1615681 RepID=UPI0021E08C48|nr:hypothetical protein [Acidicapsa acidisoli]
MRAGRTNLAPVTYGNNSRALAHRQISPDIAANLKEISELLGPANIEDRGQAKLRAISDFVANDMNAVDRLIKSGAKNQDVLAQRKKRLLDFQQTIRRSEDLGK